MGSGAPASLEFVPANVRIGVIGLGYVGLPLAVEFARKYPVVGFDVKQSRIDELSAGKDSTLEVDSADLVGCRIPALPSAAGNGPAGTVDPRPAPGLYLTSSSSDLANCNVFIVTVPTRVHRLSRRDRGGLRAGTGARLRSQAQQGFLRRLFARANQPG